MRLMWQSLAVQRQVFLGISDQKAYSQSSNKSNLTLDS